MGASPPRSLADELRSWPEDRLLGLLRERPDLVTPAPHDSAQLASRAATRASLLRALDQLTHTELLVLDALVLLTQTTRSEIASILHAGPESVDAAVDRLTDLALAWEAPGGLRALTGVADVVRGLGSGLQPLSRSRVDIATATTLIDELSPGARALLDHLDAAGGEGRTEAARRRVDPGTVATPVEEVIAHSLVLPRESGTVFLPGEVGLALRGGRTTREPVDVAPELAVGERDQAMVDRAAAGAAFEIIRRLESLCDRWSTAPPTVLRAGGLGVRDLRQAAAELGVDEPTAALVVELAVGARLVTRAAAPDGTPVWMPTDGFDAWTALPAAERWERVVRTWLGSERMPGLVGGRDRQDRPINALTDELSSPLAVETRRLTLAELAALAPGAVLATGTGSPSLVARLEFLRPRRPRLRADLAVWTLREAAQLGVVALGGLATPARALLCEEDSAAEALAPLLPAPVSHVVVQADLTAVAPGPLESALARKLALVADVESRGGATVYRFTKESVRRGFDAGWTAAELHAFVDEVSATAVPQPLSYLIDDTARVFGTVRVGAAEAFIRADDETALAELLAHPQAASLGLRRIAPTVLVTDTPIDTLLPRLRELGGAPVVEAPDGTVRVARPDLLRARTPKNRQPPGLLAARESSQLTQAVRAIRAGDTAASTRPAPSVATTPSGTLAALRGAVESGQAMLIDYVDNHGASTERLVDPQRVEGGWLTAYDRRTDESRTFAVHRITSVRPVEPA